MPANSANPRPARRASRAGAPRPAWVGALLLCVACSSEVDTPRSMPGDGAARAAKLDGAVERAAPLEIPADAPLVAFLGDSIAAGLHLDASAAFPSALQRRLARAGRPFRLVNAGVSGDTSAGGLRRVDWILSQKPAVLVLELGGNDALRGQGVSDTLGNLRAIVRKAKDAGAAVLLCGVRVPTSLGVEYSTAFDALYPALAREEGVELAPYFMEGVGGVPEMNLEDGLHPTVEGHERIAANLAPHLERVLAAASTAQAR
jgi:acyl-CoA thioesterase-1